ncbi:MAG: hypothetical protein JXR95_00835 [Deltaproteobacteria bacterium]|nr:hypothetical protein [Deltaproteobacteria bacterium]
MKFFVLSFLIIIEISPAQGSKGSPKARQRGHILTMGKTRFMIWGAASTGIMPKGCSVSPDGKWLFVSNFGRKNVKNISVYETPSLKFHKYLSYRGNSVETAVSPDSKTLYSTNMYGYYLDVIDIGAFTLRKRIKIGYFPKLILLNRAGDTAFISLWEGAGFMKVDTVSGVKKRYVTRKGNPRGLSLSPDEKTLYVANNRGKTYTVVDLTGKLKNSVPPLVHHNIGRGPRHTALSSDGKTLYISTLGSSSVYVLDTKTKKVIKRVPVGKKPKTIELSKDGKFLYTANYTGHSISIMDTSTFEVKTLDVDIVRASGLTVGHNDRFIYVTGWCSDDVWAIMRLKDNEKVPVTLGPSIKRRGLDRKSPRDWFGCSIKKSRK